MGKSFTKKIRVAGLDYTIFESKDKDIVAILDSIKDALARKTVVDVPVLDESGNKAKIVVNGATVEALFIDPGEGPPKPGELSP
jgi:hypothetical protein